MNFPSPYVDSYMESKIMNRADAPQIDRLRRLPIDLFRRRGELEGQ